MNLLVLTTSFNVRGHFVYELSKRLNEKKDFRVTVLCPHRPDAKIKENVSGLNIYRFPYFYPFSYQKIHSDDDIVYNLMKNYLARLQIPLFFLSSLFHTIKIISKEKIDIVNSHWLIPQGLVGAICKKFLGIHHVITIHSSGVTFIKKVPAGRKIAEFILNNSDLILSVSSHRAHELLSFISVNAAENMKGKFQIIPMGIDLGEFSDKRDRKNELRSKYGIRRKSVVFFIGRLVKVKGCEYLIKGFKSVLARFGDTKLIIVGRGPLEFHLKKTVEDLNIEEHVRFDGFVEHDKVRDYYHLSDIVVFPSIEDSLGCKEGMPLVLLEAFAAGKPIIATRTGGFLEAIEDGWNGFLVQPKNPEQIAEKILELLKNQGLRTKFSENALESSRKYDWKLIAEKYIEIFSNMN